MPCYSPLDAYRQEGGGKLLFGNKPDCESGFLSLPCGQCIGCKLDRSVNWAIRIMHESQMHDFSSFVTLTYSDEYLPYGGDLYYRHFQLFRKRLRERLGRPVRHFTCGEYGDKLGRPHFHSCLFGVHFADRYPWRKSAAGFQLYRSPLLDSLWDLGSAEIGNLSFDSAAYVARYCTKKITGDMAESHYRRTVLDTGEIISITPEFAKCSNRPGIGATWFDKYKDEVLARDNVVMNAAELPIPRYYKSRLSEDEWSDLVMRRYAASTGSCEASYDRLRAREACTLARVSFNVRCME